VFASSVVARIGVANHETIAAAKGGVEALVRSAAATYAGQGLRINAVAPGMTDTPMTAGMLKLPAMREGAARQYPLGGVQTAEQIAGVMSWLLGDGAARLTGQVIAVDGGSTTVRPLVKKRAVRGLDSPSGTRGNRPDSAPAQGAGHGTDGQVGSYAGDTPR
jgi:NAD(P)-dependent dehydrogenase (short-subunit alcohol dehydrogenase family)